MQVTCFSPKLTDRSPVPMLREHCVRSLNMMVSVDHNNVSMHLLITKTDFVLFKRNKNNANSEYYTNLH